MTEVEKIKKLTIELRKAQKIRKAYEGSDEEEWGEMNGYCNGLQDALDILIEV